MSAEESLVLQLAKRVHDLEYNQRILLDRISVLEKNLPSPKREEEGKKEKPSVQIGTGTPNSIGDIYSKIKFRPFGKITVEGAVKKFIDLLKNRAFSSIKCKIENSGLEGEECEISGPGNLYVKKTGHDSMNKAKFAYLSEVRFHPEYYQHAIITCRTEFTDNPTGILQTLLVDGKIFESKDPAPSDLWKLEGVYKSYLVTKNGFSAPEFSCMLQLSSTKDSEIFIMGIGKGDTKRRAREDASRYVIRKHIEWAESLTYREAVRYQNAE